MGLSPLLLHKYHPTLCPFFPFSSYSFSMLGTLCSWRATTAELICPCSTKIKWMKIHVLSSLVPLCLLPSVLWEGRAHSQGTICWLSLQRLLKSVSIYRIWSSILLCLSVLGRLKSKLRHNSAPWPLFRSLQVLQLAVTTPQHLLHKQPGVLGSLWWLQAVLWGFQWYEGVSKCFCPRELRWDEHPSQWGCTALLSLLRPLSQAAHSAAGALWGTRGAVGTARWAKGGTAAEERNGKRFPVWIHRYQKFYWKQGGSLGTARMLREVMWRGCSSHWGFGERSVGRQAHWVQWETAAM